MPILEADYTSRVALKELLRNHGVQVIISALSLYDDENASAQMTLINAAIESGTVKRFLPSEFGVDYSCPGVVESYPGAKWFNDAADALRKFELEFTRVVFGQLSDFYGFPHYKSCMKQFTYFLDFKSKKAALPGDGEATATFLHSVDIAKYTAALLNEEKWPETSAFASDRMSWIDLVKMAERVMSELISFKLLSVIADNCCYRREMGHHV